jgi:hypothetical protein
MILIVEETNAAAVMASITAFEKASGNTKYMPRMIGKVIERGDGDAVVYSNALNL